MDPTQKEFDRIDREFEEAIAREQRAELKYEIVKFSLGMVLLAIILTIVMACSKAGTPTPVSGAIDSFNVTFLFDIEGCKVYRFEDGHSHYLTTCNGEISTRQSCGKNCTYEDKIPTIRNKIDHTNY